MARPKNPAHRAALLAAATRVFAGHGLGASTAMIAKEAGVSAGTLFVYFDTKTTLINELYVTLKGEMAQVATAGLRASDTPRDQLRRMWDNWIIWATIDPNRHRALAQLSVAEDLSGDSHQAVRAAYAGIAELLAAITADGPMQDVPLGFTTALMSAIAETTIDDLIRHPDPGGIRSSTAFGAMWRALTGPSPTETGATP